ncbi:GPO family capsid scaffolding protein [Glaesserella parasuis]|uniref:GPO family capsid scaffolding protein n=1 Tax=Glaesserella parasuis TaxID=738 RepID=UPI0009930E10|nr:GPO family capsid scaffolding protein [Glaesserella parasuis]MCT8526267.1 GPO family capsid scaffolding protein [Glaesserella parasuis]MCT8528437.1 GPO family capsid scaffolding protein [Glaesserella parasuis]MCT8530904.1 GPO family capsid scaffolding protein [Glaesserella parasuis]MCT8533092.1 GPO family capsid scaffolding protein [Glaesserella parasuis]MCT8537174.1 GPO family capsid scaffolding protein [Glaesserella parasuis]
MTQLKTGLVCIATSGNTVDGRYISPKELEEMAQTYDPSYYTALIWYEHSRNGANLGKVLSLTTVKNGNEVKLFAILSPNAFLVELNSKKQKLFTSIEIVPNFANTGKCYLGGLAVTDSPASVGTTMLQFSAGFTQQFKYLMNNFEPLQMFSTHQHNSNQADSSPVQHQYFGLHPRNNYMKVYDEGGKEIIEVDGYKFSFGPAKKTKEYQNTDDPNIKIYQDGTKIAYEINGYTFKF